MSIKLLTWNSLKTPLIFINLLLSSLIFAQDTIYQNVSDTNLFPPDTAIVDIDETDTIYSDTISTDTVIIKKSETKPVDSKVEYTATDSIRFNTENQKVFLYREADIKYEAIELKAAYVEIDFDKSTAYAQGMKDTAGEIYGDPVFTEKGQSYKSRTMKYNYDTRKGIIHRVFTEDGDGYLHGEIVKKMENDEINIKSGSYTTCNKEVDPHFEFKYYKSKVIPGKKIITGPAYLVIEGVPTPLFIPFGIFPNEKGQRSGIVIPTYGESASRGFYFENGGYYWAASDYIDLKLVGDIYTRGSWAVKPSTNYRKRYKYSGRINLTYAINKVGEKESADYQESKDFAIRWSHSQDPKARPNSRFSANVNIVSNQYNVYNPTSTQDYLSNTFQSSIAYQAKLGDNYNLTVNASHSQNTKTKMIDMTIPEINFSVNRFNPFERKRRTGKQKWYEKISMNYNMNAKNTMSIPDSMFFEPGFLDEFKNGIKHQTSISSPIKVLKHFNLTNNITVTDRMYFRSYRKTWVNDTIIENDNTAGYYKTISPPVGYADAAYDTIIGYVKTDTINKFHNILDFSFSSSLTTKLYGMLSFKKGPLRAIRHVMTPSVSFSYTPDFGDENWGYYGYYYDESLSQEVQYSFSEGAIYGSPPNSKSGRLGFSISNNLEIKVPSKKDTITGTKKIALIDNFTISASYDLARDSLRWSKLSMRGRTRLFKGLNLTYSSRWDPYILDSTGTKNLNKYEWEINRRLFRHENTTWNIGLNLNLSSDQFKKKGKKNGGADEGEDNVELNSDEYIDWTIPWTLNINYNLRYTTSDAYNNYELNREKKLVQTLDFNGNISITKKWKIGFRSGYDFEQGKLSYTSLNIYRDLHCWEMRFNWIPMGPRKSWNFTINVKSSMLQDLKLTKKKDFRDL